MKSKLIVTAVFLNAFLGLCAGARAGTFSPADLLSGSKVIQQCITAVPEPSTYVLLGVGAAALMAMSRRRGKN